MYNNIVLYYVIIFLKITQKIRNIKLYNTILNGRKTKRRKLSSVHCQVASQSGNSGFKIQIREVRNCEGHQTEERIRLHCNF